MIGRNNLRLDLPGDLGIRDQCLYVLLSLGPSLLIYDDVRSAEALKPWLPPAGMLAHVLVTSVVASWDPGWITVEVPPLDDGAARELIEKLTGADIAGRYGDELVALAAGLPDQLVPAAATLVYEVRRGRGETAALTLTREAEEGFRGVYEQLEVDARLVLRAAAGFDIARVLRTELEHMTRGMGWEPARLNEALDAAGDLHLLEDGPATFRLHPLLARFLRSAPTEPELAASLPAVRRAQAQRWIELAGKVAENPANVEWATSFLAYPARIEDWITAELSGEESAAIGKALRELGRFGEGLVWSRCSLTSRETGSVDGSSLGEALDGVGSCLSSLGRFEEARHRGGEGRRARPREFGAPWQESAPGRRAVAAAEKGDVHGRVDSDSLGWSLHELGFCSSSLGQLEEARSAYEKAVAAKRKGDVFGRLDRSSLALSLKSGAGVLRKLGEEAEAAAWEAEAAALDPTP